MATEAPRSTAQQQTSAEAQRISAQQQLDAERSSAERNRWGQFATPPTLALDIARHVRRLWHAESTRGPVALLEPALGSGAFYSAFLSAFGETQHRATGIELDPRLARAARKLWAKWPLQVEQQDFTELRPRPQFNLLLTNPPYVRHHHLGPTAKERLRGLVKQRLGLRVSGLAGLYCYFLLLADGWLKRDALAAWLIPAEFLAVNYGAVLREYLSQRVALTHVHLFAAEDVQFSDALVSSAIVVLRKRPPGTGENVCFSRGGPISAPAQRTLVAREELAAAERWTHLAQCRPRRTKPRAVGPRVPLSEWFTIKRGLATGDNRFFILERPQARELGISEEFLRPILPSPRHLEHDVIQAAADGYPLLERQLCLIDCRLSETTLRRRCVGLYRYLQQGATAGVAAGYLASRRRPWYSQEERPAAPFLCTYMGRSNEKREGAPFRLLWNRSPATAANVYLLLYPRGELALRLAEDQELAARLHAVLARTTREALAHESRAYGGGLRKLEPSELARVDLCTAAQELGLTAEGR